MIQDVDAVEIRTCLSRKCTDLFCVAENGDLRYALAGANRRGLNGSDVLALGQNNVLRISCRTLSDLFQDHIYCVEFSIQAGRPKLAQNSCNS